MLKLKKSVTKSITKTVVEDPGVRKLAHEHPRFFGFLKKRTDPDARFGLNLTLGVIIAGFFLVLFLGIVQDLIGNEALVLADLRIVNLLQIFRTPSFNKAMLFITYLGKGQLILVGVVAVGAILASRRRWYHAIALLTSVAVGEFLVLLLKNLIHRPRPPLVNVLAPEQTYSFPSGHSFVAIAFYGLIAYFVFTSVKSRLAKALAVIAALSIILAVGFSRIYLGAHFPSDVLGGYAAGLAWLTAIITALETRMRDNAHRNPQPYVSKNAAVIIGLLAFTIWGGFVLYYYETHPLKAPSTTVEKPAIITPRDIPGRLFLR